MCFFKQQKTGIEEAGIAYNLALEIFISELVLFKLSQAKICTENSSIIVTMTQSLDNALLALSLVSTIGI